ncbi:MAG: hypothetical protein VZR73_11485 [Acutalibacteraceae bacterium]|nr:hypothetical protein [Acutalibacteraceae bacterium]
MKGVLGALALVVVVAVVIFLLFKFGLLPFGKGSGNGGSGTGTSSVAEVSEAAEAETEVPAPAVTTTVEEKIYVDVTVSGNSYLYQNSTLELDALLAELEKLDDEITVRITDEKASLKAYENLTKALDEKKISFEPADE